jgi:phage FluMu gp28-like protein
LLAEAMTFPESPSRATVFQTLRAAIDAEGDHRSSFRMFSRYSCPPLSSVGAGCERAIFSSSANDALPARIFFSRSEFHEAYV